MKDGFGDPGDWTRTLSSTALPSSEEAAFAQRRDGRERGRGEPLPIGLDRARLDLELLGAAQHLRNAERHAAKLMPNLLRVGRHAEKAQYHHQRDETGIDRRGAFRFKLVRHTRLRQQLALDTFNRRP